MKYTIPKDYTTNGITSHFEELKYLPYAQACIMWHYDEHNLVDSVSLISYNTTVITIESDGTLWCTGTYSNTTARHINRFCKEMSEFFRCPVFTYYTCKTCYCKDMTYNIHTGEFKPIRNDNGNLYI